MGCITADVRDAGSAICMDGLPLRRFVFGIQNHDRIGNRAR